MSGEVEDYLRDDGSGGDDGGGQADDDEDGDFISKAAPYLFAIVGILLFWIIMRKVKDARTWVMCKLDGCKDGKPEKNKRRWHDRFYALGMNPDGKPEGSKDVSDGAVKSKNREDEKKVLWETSDKMKNALREALEYVHVKTPEETAPNCTHYFPLGGTTFDFGAVGKTEGAQRCDAVRYKMEKVGGEGWKPGFLMYATRHKT